MQGPQPALAGCRSMARHSEGFHSLGGPEESPNTAIGRCFVARAESKLLSMTDMSLDGSFVLGRVVFPASRIVGRRIETATAD